MVKVRSVNQAKRKQKALEKRQKRCVYCGIREGTLRSNGEIQCDSCFSVNRTVIALLHPIWTIEVKEKKSKAVQQSVKLN